jgi:hypothetical protein
LIAAGTVLGANLSAAVFGGMLEAGRRNTATGIVAALAIFVPVINVLAVLAISRDATEILRKHGYRVGILGANPRQLDCQGQHVLGFATVAKATR